MEYQNWATYKQGWIFRHRELPVAAADLELIKPLSAMSAAAYWRQHISAEATHASQFLADDWPAAKSTWQQQDRWQEAWDQDEPSLPELLQTLDWDDNTVVFFCYDHEHIVQTTWAVWQRCWKNFLFYDDAPILMARRRQQVGQFFSDGTMRLGMRP